MSFQQKTVNTTSEVRTTVNISLQQRATRFETRLLLLSARAKVF